MLSRPRRDDLWRDGVVKIVTEGGGTKRMHVSWGREM